MESSEIIDSLLGILGFIGIFFIKSVINNQKASDSEISKLKIELATHKVYNETNQAQFAQIQATMIRLESKWDEKFSKK